MIKYTAAGTRQWGTYYGGTGQESGWANVETDLSGNVYLSGTTESAGAIATPGASQVTKSTAASDGYLAKFNTNGVRQWGTYFGAAGGNTGMKCMWVDGGNVYLAAYTQAPGLATTNAYQTTLGPNSATMTDAVVVKMSDANSAVVWATYYGGDGLDQPAGICSDADNRVYVGGVTESTTGFGSVGSHQSTLGRGQDGFMVRFHECGTVTGTVVTTNVCAGFSNGSITVTPSGGVAPYQYKLVSGTYQQSPTLGGLATGPYIVVVKDDNGCEGQINANVGQNPAVAKPSLGGTFPVERDATITYITTALPGLTFNWVVTGGGTITSGQGTTSIQVKWNTIGNGEVKLIATGIAPCSDSTVMSVKIDAPASVKDIAGSTLALYPNPNSGSFVLKGETVANKEMQVQVLNAIGHVVYTEAISSNNGMVEKQYNLSHLASGIYTVVLESDAGRQNIRLIITR